MNEEIQIEVRREVCRHNSRVAGWHWVSAPPHVQRFVSGSLSEVLLQLAANGYRFGVRCETVEVSVIDWLGKT